MGDALKTALDLYQEHKYDEALGEFLKMEEEYNGDSRLLNNIALCYANTHDFEKAEYYYQKALSYDAKQAQIYVNFADLLFQQQKIVEAIELLQNAIYELPENVTVRHYLARVYLEDKRFDEAISTLDTVLELSPKNPDAHWDLGMLYFELGDWYSAISNFEEVVETVDNNPLIFYQLGLAYEANDELDKAMTAYFKAIAANQDFPLAYKKLGMLFMARNDAEDAIEYYETYLSFELPEEEKAQIEKIIGTLKLKLNDIRT